MEGFGGLGFSNMSSTTRKKRSNTLRRPWNEPQLQPELHDGSSLSSTPTSDNNVNKVEEREPVESDEGSSNGSFQGSTQEMRHSEVGSSRSTEGLLALANWKSSGNFENPGNESTVRKVKLKVGGLTKTVDANSVSDGASGVGSSSTKSSHISDDASRLRQRNLEISNDRSATSDKVGGLRGIPWKGFVSSGPSARKADSSNIRSPGDDLQAKQTDKNQPIRKSKRISRRRVLDEELEDIEDDDDEIRYLERVKMAKVAAVYDDDDEGRSRKHRKLSKVMKQDVEGPRSTGASGRSGKLGKKQKPGKLSDDTDYVEDEEEEEEVVFDGEVENKRARSRKGGIDLSGDLKTEMTVTTRQRALQTGKDTAFGVGGNPIEFPYGLPPAPPRKQKEKLSEVEQQLKKAEAAQRRRMQVEKAARESEAEAIRKILGQDSSRKKREEKIKKRQEEKAKEKAANSIALQSDTVRWVMGPSGTVVTFPDEVGLPTIFDSKPHSYPPPRERCAGPECTNPYKYRDSKSNLPLCSLQCYKALQRKTGPLTAC